MVRWSQWRDAAAHDGIDNGHGPSVSPTEKGEFVEIHLPVVMPIP